MKKYLLKITLTLTVCIMFSCDTAKEKSDEINIYSQRHYDVDQIQYDNFEKSTGIKVNVIKSNADELIQRMENEGDNSPADLFITVDVGKLWQASNMGLLQKYQDESLTDGITESLLDKKPGTEFTITAKFPDDYFKQDLAGQDAEFDINLIKVQENKPAEINKDLFEKLSMEVKDETEFKEEIKSRMDKEVEAQEKALTKESIYELLLKSHSFKAPNSTVKEQSELMRKDALMRIGQSVENAEVDLFPIESFSEDASKRVRLDLLFAELIKHYEIKVDDDKLKEFIAEEGKKYKDSAQFEAWVVSQPKQLEQFNMMILENELIEKLENDLKSKDKVIKFSELANK